MALMSPQGQCREKGNYNEERNRSSLRDTNGAEISIRSREGVQGTGGITIWVNKTHKGNKQAEYAALTMCNLPKPITVGAGAPAEIRN